MGLIKIRESNLKLSFGSEEDMEIKYVISYGNDENKRIQYVILKLR